MKKVITILAIVISTLANAQYSETISSGRPGQAIGAFTVGKKVFQIQAGVDYLKKAKATIPNATFRYAISDRFEINTGIGYTFADGLDDLSSFSAGTRINLSNGEEGMIPMGLQVSFNVPTKNIEFGSKVLFIISDSFTDKLSWTVNVGSDFDKKYNTNGIYILNLSYAVNDKIGLFIEPYGTINNDFNLNFDAGMSYLINKDLQLDVLGGYGINTDEGLMLGIGFSWRFLTGKI